MMQSVGSFTELSSRQPSITEATPAGPYVPLGHVDHALLHFTKVTAAITSAPIPR